MAIPNKTFSAVSNKKPILATNKPIFSKEIDHISFKRTNPNEMREMTTAAIRAITTSNDETGQDFRKTKIRDPITHAGNLIQSGKWVAAADLKPGDKVLLANGKYGTIQSVSLQRLDTPETTYNLEVENAHTYFVGEQGVLVHNRGCNRLKPDTSADGDHSTFARDSDSGRITKYATYQRNTMNPNGFEEIMRFDGVGDLHYNKVLQKYVGTPHIHNKSLPGGVGFPSPWQLPKKL